MDVSTRFSITEKGTDEIERRTHQLSIRKRSVLVHLNKPQTVDYILGKSVFQPDEVIYEIKVLEQDGYLEVSERDTPEL